MAELVIRISGDIKNYEEALDKASKETSDLGDELGSIAAKSAIAFAALTAEIGLSVAAFKESEAVTNKLSAALQSQGIYSKALVENYEAQAKELQNLTGLSDEAIVSAQTTIQSFIGQTAVSRELTGAIADLSAAKGLDLQSTAALIGKGISGHSAALKKLGIDIDENKTKQEQLAQVIDIVSQKFGGQAEAAGKGLGSIDRLKQAFDNFQEELGKKFAPAITLIATKMTDFFNFLSQNKAITDFIVSLITAATVVTGLVAAIAAGGIVFLQFRAALAAANVSVSLMTLGIRGLIGATGLGLLVLLVTEIALNWNTVWPRMQAVFQAFVQNVSALLGNLGNLLVGVFTLDTDKISASLAGLKTTLQKGLTEATKDLTISAPKVDDSEQNAAQKQAADKAVAEQKRKEDLLQASHKAHKQALYLESQRASEDEINLIKQRADLLKQLAEAESSEERAAIQQRLQDNAALRAEYTSQERDQKRADFEQTLAENEEYQALDEEQKTAFRIKNEATFQQNSLNEKQARSQAAQERLDIQTKEHNTFLLNQQKFGTAYATINQVMNSTIVQGSAKAFGELAQLQQSSNSTLKGIGKAAATAQIIIKTAESAMNIYNGFSTIPLIGPALGVAGAAAAIAFGAEQIGKVNAAADGGLLQGGIPGVDSIPVLAQQGELVVPRQNFVEVVDAVDSRRSRTSSEGQPAAAISGPLQLVITLKDSLMDFIDIQSAERQQLGLTIKGTT